MQNRYQLTRELLEKPVWTISDIQAWSGFKKDKATAILKAAKEKGGGVAIGSKYATSDSILKLFGTSRLAEMEVLMKGEAQ